MATISSAGATEGVDLTKVMSNASLARLNTETPRAPQLEDVAEISFDGMRQSAITALRAETMLNLPGTRAELIKAMPGIMRPLIAMNKQVEITTRAHTGNPADTVVNSNGTHTTAASRLKVCALPKRSVKCPK